MPNKKKPKIFWIVEGREKKKKIINNSHENERLMN